MKPPSQTLAAAHPDVIVAVSPQAVQTARAASPRTDPRYVPHYPTFGAEIVGTEMLDVRVIGRPGNDNADTLAETLEALVGRLLRLRRQDAAGTAEHRMVLRQIEGLRYSREGANEIIETLNPDGWGLF